MAPRPLPAVPARREAVAQAAADVRHARPPVQRQDLQPDGSPCLHALDDQDAVPGVLEEVGRGLGHDECDLRRARLVEAEATGQQLGDPACLTHLRGVVEREGNRLRGGYGHVTSTS